MATEKRLIDADALVTAIVNTPSEVVRLHSYNVLSSLAERQHEILDIIENAPTVDAVVLPCKVGDKVFRIDEGNYCSDWKPFVEELTVTEISWKRGKYNGPDLGFAIIADGIRYKFSSIGKSVFLTREEAEVKMDGERINDGKTD